MSLERYLGEFTARDWQDVEEGGPIRFAMVGMGWWTREQAIPAVENTEFCETTVVVSSSIEDPDAVAETDVEHAITYEEYADGVAADAYDAVYVATPNALHLDHVEAAAALGKDVLCEKPMEVSTERARRLAEVCDDHDVALMIAYRIQTEPAARRARDLVRDGLIGDPVQVYGGMGDDLLSNVGGDTDHWRLDPDLAGGCAMIDIGIYPLNTARFLLDEDPVAVWGTTRTSHEAFSGLDEHVSFEAAFPGDLTAVCAASHNARKRSHLRVLGTDGEVRLEPIFFPTTARRLIVEHGGTEATITFDQRDQMTEEFEYFGHCLITDTDPAPDGEHGIVDIEAIEAVYDSAETCERVEL